MSNVYDLAIIGGGPGGVAGGVYSARKRLKTIFITGSFGGQSAVSEQVQNWIGTVSLSGNELAENLKKHLEAYASDTVDIKEGEEVSSLKKSGENFLIKTNKGEYEAKTVLITTGSHRRKLDIPGAAEFDGRGLTYCASCDGPLFSGKDVAIIGGGNAAFESASQLLAYAKSVTLLNRSDDFKADPVTVRKMLSNPKMKALTNAVPVEIKGDKFVKSLVYMNKEKNDKIELPISGIFVEIGLIPASDFASEVAKRNEYGQIIVDPKNQQTSTKGIWAAGDCTDGLYHQNNIAAGDAVKALEDIYLYLNLRGK